MSITSNSNITESQLRNYSLDLGQTRSAKNDKTSSSKAVEPSQDILRLANQIRNRAEAARVQLESRSSISDVSALQMADMSSTRIDLILNRLTDLAQSVGVSGDTENVANIQFEIEQLGQEINHIVATTRFNDRNLIDGEFGVNRLGPYYPVDIVPQNGVLEIDVANSQAGTIWYVSELSENPAQITLTNGKQQQTLDVSEAIALERGEQADLNFDELGLRIRVDERFSLDNLRAGSVNDASRIYTIQDTAAVFSVPAENGERERVALALPDLSFAALLGNDFAQNVVEGDTQAVTESLEQAKGVVSQVRESIQQLLDRYAADMNAPASLDTSFGTSIESSAQATDFVSDLQNGLLETPTLALVAQNHLSAQAVYPLLLR